MLKLKVTASWPVLDRKRYLMDFQAAINQSVIKAARAFLVAAVPRIPILTGMARSAFSNLEDFAGRLESNGTSFHSSKGGRTRIVPRKGRKYYYYPPGGTRIERTNISGRQFATPLPEISGEGRLTKVTQGSRFVFKFEVNIKYVDINEPRWQAFEMGRKAFNETLKVELDKTIPDMGKYFIKREIK